MALNEKQKRFADEYIIDLNATQAAIRAGYSQKTARSQGQRLLTKVDIQAYMADKMEQHVKPTIAKQEEVLETLTKVLRGEESGATLRGTGKGSQVVDDMPPTTTERIRAAELLGKRYGIWQENKTVDVRSAVTFVDDILDDADGTD
ncbi:terminase small subunit [Sporosarcina sp. P17b]|uniref:terminase small subunit n=1 Tax=Sporosarcina sp. P17b TaxID=2048260 RepID=UPI000C164CEA|nr:terminase small subunit [Sporosarcina sp. P17b]PIC73331.1 terminase small subunit [Sporosarcina sp. P17b]